MNDFSKGSVKKRIIEQAIPLTLARVVQMLYNPVDRMLLTMWFTLYKKL